MRKFLLGILISLPFLMAQPFPHQSIHPQNPPQFPEVVKRPNFENFLEEMGIKSAQKQKMLDMWFNHKKKMVDIRASIKKMEIDMQRLLMADKLNEQKIIGQAKAIGEARVNEKVENLKFKFKVLNLIPEKHKEEIKRFLFHSKRGLRMENMRKMIRRGKKK